MLKKLRLKFVLFAMAIVTLMLVMIFVLLYFSTSRSLALQNIQMMESMAMDQRPASRPNAPPDDARVPYFAIDLDENDEVANVRGSYFDLSDDTSIMEILEAAASEEHSDGYLKEYNLRYRIFETPNGETIVFSDTSNESQMLDGLVKTFILVGGIAYILFLGLSILMARWAVKPVENAWIQQKQFVADASHELKTPLTVIMTNAELLNENECPTSDRKQFSGNIITMSKQMRGLVESLLELARIDAGTKQAAHQSLNLSETVSTAAMNFEPVFFEKGLTFSYDIEPDIMVNGNVSQLKQLVEILLDNAAKYSSPSGETNLSLKSVSKKSCTIEVRNQGDQISDEDLENIFKRFYRADKARAMNHSYGLGLSIAQSICDEHHGKISAASADGWNIFTATIPKED